MKLDNLQGQDFDWSIADQTFEGGTVKSAPTIADVNGDGLAELVMANGTSSTEASIHAYGLGIPYNPESIQWNGYMNGPRHAGLYAQPVTGNQPLDEMTWSGRITVHGTYTVNSGKFLTIKPGTVIELMPNSTFEVCGGLMAQGTVTDSIYFTELGGGHTAHIAIGNSSGAFFQYCKIHGMDQVGIVQTSGAAIEHCSIRDMERGLEVIEVEEGLLTVDHNVIEDCSLYGIHGTFSSGEFSENTISNCTRAGIYWHGDRTTPYLQPPTFMNNHISWCGTPNLSPIAGAYFYCTHARLGCNTLEYNFPYQIECEGSADIVMNGDYTNMGINTLHNESCTVHCWSCDPSCQICNPPSDHLPLLMIRNSWPHLDYGFNTFQWDDHGVYACDPTLYCVDLVHQMRLNTFLPDTTEPRMHNFHFCPDTAFSAHWNFWDPRPHPLGCLVELEEPIEELAALTPEGVYQQAALSEKNEQYATAAQQYDAVIDQYPASEEAVWATRGELRTALRASESALTMHDTLAAIADNMSISERTRGAALRESIWSLVAGSEYT
ncbi:MAG: right-handed parallel beta-helix repeat-containing protein, partial [Ignavibacteriales bacterium]|nr:right-handed parallel beta-helix repeat-containing protein [Ignavibacteriales bacterium]